MTQDNFKDHPQTLATVRAAASGDAADWKARDLLIDLLRKIDNGLVVDNLVMFYRIDKDDEKFTTYSCATTDVYAQLGVVEIGRMKMKRDMLK